MLSAAFHLLGCRVARKQRIVYTYPEGGQREGAREQASMEGHSLTHSFSKCLLIAWTTCKTLWRGPRRTPGILILRFPGRDKGNFRCVLLTIHTFT